MIYWLKSLQMISKNILNLFTKSKSRNVSLVLVEKDVWNQNFHFNKKLIRNNMSDLFNKKISL